MHISVRWVDVNKGDDGCPTIRSRLVAREIRNAGSESVFAPTPPLEALRTILSLATTRLPGDEHNVWDGDHRDRMQISLVDISRAYFNARTDPSCPTFVQLPPEHAATGKGKVRRVLKHMHGTQRAKDLPCELSCELFGAEFAEIIRRAHRADILRTAAG